MRPVTLRKIQTDSLAFLLGTPRAYLVATCGAGKTLTILKYLALLDEFEGPGTTLIVAPKNVVELTWPNEMAKWGVEPPVMLRGKNWTAEKGRVHLCTYAGLERLRRDVFKNGRKRPFTRAIFDEITFAKNPSSSRINKVRGILHKSCSRVVGMTGTPIPNKLKDIFAQIRLIDGGSRLGTASEDFYKKYFVPGGYKNHDWVPRTPEVVDEITEQISDVSLTLQAKDYDDIEMPEIVEHDIEVALPKNLRAQLTELQDELVLMLENKSEVVADTAAILSTKCLQLCSGMVISGEDEDREENWLNDFRLKAVKKHLKGKSAIVLATFRLAQRKLKESLNGAFLTKTSFKDFVSGNLKHLVGHYGNMAHGIDGLQGASDTVVWYSPPWSRDGYDQANARLARPGGSDVVHVYRFYCPGTLEEAVLEALRDKEATQSEFIESLAANIRKLKR